jgi:hypothetical protein
MKQTYAGANDKNNWKRWVERDGAGHVFSVFETDEQMH